MEKSSKTLLFVVLLNILAIVLVIILFKYLNSEASISGTYAQDIKWQAGGALAGYIILVVVQFYIYKAFSPKGSEKYSSCSTIYTFYDFQNKKEWRKSWEYLSPDFQHKRWDSDPTKFENGYKNTQGLKWLAIDFVSELSKYSHEWVVYYQDETNAPILPGLARVGEFPLKDLPLIVNNVEDIRKMMQDKGIKTIALDNMALSQLLSSNRGDILRWKIAQVDGDQKADELFPNLSTVKRMVGKRVVVNNVNKKWLIDHIDDVPYNIE